MTKTLIISNDKDDYFFPYVDNESIVIDSCWNKRIYKKYIKIVRLCELLHFPLTIFLGKWTAQIKEFSKIIIFSGCFEPFLKLYLDKKIPNTPKFIYCWNPKERWEELVRYTNCFGRYSYPIFSYSVTDSKMLGINYQHTFYTDNIKTTVKEPEYDVVFVGRTKNRMELLNRIYNYCNDNCLKLFWHVYDTEERPFPTSDNLINYIDYLEIVNKSKVILDIVEKNYDGLSLRAMESLFFDKKLITTNEAIINYDFYRKENIFILNDETWGKVKEFMAMPYKEISKDTKDQYIIENWIKGFKIDKVTGNTV